MKPQMDDMFKAPKPNGQGWIFSGVLAEQVVAQVLQWREEVSGGQPYDLLPLELQKVIQRKHFELWRDDPAQADKVRTVTERRRGVKHKIFRDLWSMHRTHCFEQFGGREWMHMIIALGRLDDLVMQCMNEAWQLRSQEKQAKKGDTWLPEGPFQEMVSASASSRGPRRVIGIQHVKSEAKVAREAAKRKEKELEREREAWVQGRSRISNNAWWRLLQDVARLWERAEELSQQAGVPYIGRGGEPKLQDMQSSGLVGRAIELWVAARQRQP